MIFWDTSAIVPLLVEEPESAQARELAQSDPSLLVWWTAPVECLSAIARREREGAIAPSAADDARRVLTALSGAWSEVTATEDVRQHAARLLLRHALRAADALQLAAAMTWARGAPSRHRLACLDDRLRAAARAEGFDIAPLAG